MDEYGEPKELSPSLRRSRKGESQSPVKKLMHNAGNHGGKRNEAKNPMVHAATMTLDDGSCYHPVLNARRLGLCLQADTKVF